MGDRRWCGFSRPDHGGGAGRLNQTGGRPVLYMDTCASLPALSRDARRAVAETPDHGRALAAAPAMKSIEVGPPPRGRLRVVFWNMERCKHVAPSAGLL